jgi:hypothetical protein
MRTSIDIPDHLLALARKRAEAGHTTLREVLLASLSRYLLEAQPAPVADGPFLVPVLSGASGGMLPGVDPTDTSALLEIE